MFYFFLQLLTNDTSLSLLVGTTVVWEFCNQSTFLLQEMKVFLLSVKSYSVSVSLYMSCDM